MKREIAELGELGEFGKDALGGLSRCARETAVREGTSVLADLNQARLWHERSGNMETNRRYRLYRRTSQSLIAKD